MQVQNHDIDTLVCLICHFSEAPPSGVTGIFKRRKSAVRYKILTVNGAVLYQLLQSLTLKCKNGEMVQFEIADELCRGEMENGQLTVHMYFNAADDSKYGNRWIRAFEENGFLIDKPTISDTPSHKEPARRLHLRKKSRP